MKFAKKRFTNRKPADKQYIIAYYGIRKPKVVSDLRDMMGVIRRGAIKNSDRQLIRDIDMLELGVNNSQSSNNSAEISSISSPVYEPKIIREVPETPQPPPYTNEQYSDGESSELGGESTQLDATAEYYDDLVKKIAFIDDDELFDDDNMEEPYSAAAVALSAELSLPKSFNPLQGARSIYEVPQYTMDNEFASMVHEYYRDNYLRIKLFHYSEKKSPVFIMVHWSHIIYAVREQMGHDKFDKIVGKITSNMKNGGNFPEIYPVELPPTLSKRKCNRRRYVLILLPLDDGEETYANYYVRIDVLAERAEALIIDRLVTQNA